MKLKKCPFCGGDAAFIQGVTDDGRKTFSVFCKHCNTGVFTPRFDEMEWSAYQTPEDAATVWNTRAEDKEEY